MNICKKIILLFIAYFFSLSTFSQTNWQVLSASVLFTNQIHNLTAVIANPITLAVNQDECLNDTETPIIDQE